MGDKRLYSEILRDRRRDQADDEPEESEQEETSEAEGLLAEMDKSYHEFRQGWAEELEARLKKGGR